MNWLEKIRFLIDQNKVIGCTGPYLIDVTPSENHWTVQEIQILRNKHPYLNNSYLDFIQEFDNIGISWANFYGSKGNKRIALLPEIDYWREEGLPEEYFPFAKGPGGEVYCFNKQNEVIEFAGDDYEFKNPVVIASSLEDFVDNDLLGKRFAKWNNIETSSFYQFLKQQGWV